jgi:hypothetical protein
MTTEIANAGTRLDVHRPAPGASSVGLVIFGFGWAGGLLDLHLHLPAGGYIHWPDLVPMAVAVAVHRPLYLLYL